MRIVCGLLLLCTAVVRADDPITAQLRRYGMQPTQESIRGYLRQLYPTADSQEQMERWAQELGHRDPSRRDYAMRSLHAAGAAAGMILQRHLSSDVPEVRRRVRVLLAETKKLLNEDAIYAAYMTVAQRHIPGLAPEVLHSLPFAGESHVRLAGLRALVATSQAADAERLRATARDPRTESTLRAAATRALGRVLGAEGVPEIESIARDPDPHVRFACAHALALERQASALPLLLALLEDGEPHMRFQTVVLLRQLAGKRHDFAAYGSEEQRAAGVARWRRWAREEAATVRWTAIDEHLGARRNRILVAFCGRPRSEIVEIDLEGRALRRFHIDGYVYGLHALPNGHALVSLYYHRRVVEFDRGGREVWTSKPLRVAPGGVQQLVSGHVLVTYPRGQIIEELDLTSRVVWSVTVPHGVHHAERMPNGITRVSAYALSQVREYDRRGRVRRTIATGAQPQFSQKLESGNTLVVLRTRNEVVEFDPKGERVRAWPQFQHPTTAFALPDGGIVVGDHRGVHRVGRDGSRRTILPSPANQRILIAYH
ncbi:MAG: HEAT repeat domain-containing protein [Planctomycetota bacterium]